MFFSRSDRIRYLGFDDRWMMLLGIPLLTVIANTLFVSTLPPETLQTSGVGGVCYLIAFSYTLIFWVTNRLAVIALRKRLGGRKLLVWRLLLNLLIALVVILIVKVFKGFVLKVLVGSEQLATLPEPSMGYQVLMSFVLCTAVLAVYEGIYFFTKYQQSLLEQEKLAKANVQAQLAALRQQVNPHFLFNSLNTLANLIPEDPTKATRFVQRLSAVYRRILEYRHEESVTLGVELAALDDYLFLLEARFEDKLTVTIDVPDAMRGARIVPLAVQLLVENAIKHNVVSSAHPLTVRIGIEDDYLVVSNNYRPRTGKIASTGLGQQNIQQRYRLLTERPVRISANETRYRVDLPLLLKPAHALA